VATPPVLDRESWRALLRPALRVVDSLVHNGYGRLDFRLGGGTVLMFRFDHRISKDIDIFTYDQAAAETVNYEEHANMVKLLLTTGDVDFIVAAPVIAAAPCEMIEFEGRTIACDATAEILAKKLLYRADSFKARDVFDMSASLSLDPASAMAALRATVSTHPALLRRLKMMGEMPLTEVTKDLVLTATGHDYVEGMVAKLIAAVGESAATDAPTGP
jgi:hypothetical protein